MATGPASPDLEDDARALHRSTERKMEAAVQLLDQVCAYSSQSLLEPRKVESYRQPAQESTPALMKLLNQNKRRRISTPSDTSPSSPDIHSLSGLLSRLATYKIATYTPKPDEIGPVAAARHGWICDGGRDRLVCQCCGKAWRIDALHNTADASQAWNSPAAKQLLTMYQARLQSHHARSCAWSLRSTPGSIYRLPTHSAHLLLARYFDLLSTYHSSVDLALDSPLSADQVIRLVNRLHSMVSAATADTANPYVDPSFVTTSRILRAARGDVSFKLNSEQETMPTLAQCSATHVVLALFGWSLAKTRLKRSGSVADIAALPRIPPSAQNMEHTLSCDMCCRRVGLWSLPSQSLSVLTEHREYCPCALSWRAVASSILGDKPALPSSGSATIVTSLKQLTGSLGLRGKATSLRNLPDDPGKQSSGYPSKLSKNQLEALKQCWIRLDEVLQGKHDRKSGASDEDVNITGEGEEDTGKGAFKGMAKEDSAKEKQRRERERAMTAKILKDIDPETFRSHVWRAVQCDSPDALLLRFLRARDFDPDAAFQMLCGSMAWRLNLDVTGILEEGEIGWGGYKNGLKNSAPNEKEAKRFMKQFHDGVVRAPGTDREGRPVALIAVKHHKIGGVSSIGLQRYACLCIESMRTALVPPAEEATMIFSMIGFGPMNMDFWAIKLLIDIFGSYYPQIVHTILIYQPPFYFRPFYAFVEPFLPAEIRDKVVFVSNPKELDKYVSLDNLPKSLGGNVEREWDYHEPSESDERTKGEDDEKRRAFFDELEELNVQFEDLTRAWIYDGDESARKKREGIQKQRYVLSRRGDEWWRASTWLHREGTVLQYGRTEWTYNDRKERWGTRSELILQEANKLLGKEAPETVDKDDAGLLKESQEHRPSKSKHSHSRRHKHAH
ncbi:uncharacterized protein L969DRAFT_610157 [Mixia osmundae IAM 14324]|uniref:CRAL-TRIO domain-containing protein n=1 Tax=Mixia osmundae (strain CBS 9802 / IAM 14324 / JCM 22182 / KY 12970) TaxID=764103 RepID=G7EAY4_MIXOS|nr:uncharacterized protein L969DRAFT_610157 [Mixia osmundae IAM 14324]KEI37029.1 hypothetical protein L969DRAFT_610157 [Mixia osmundae IAM 14324]GAA99994.1 hypothetical protein E5Q_06697 [Mixia osmundae IAM 14324]